MKQVQKSTNKWNLCPFLIRTKCYRQYYTSRNQREAERKNSTIPFNKQHVCIYSQPGDEGNIHKKNRNGMVGNGQSETRSVRKKPAVDHCFRLPLKPNEAKECNLSIICFRSHISLDTAQRQFSKTAAATFQRSYDFRRFMEICVELASDSFFRYFTFYCSGEKSSTRKIWNSPTRARSWRRLCGGRNENNGFYVIICERKRSINSTDLKEITNEIRQNAEQLKLIHIHTRALIDCT